MVLLVYGGSVLPGRVCGAYGAQNSLLPEMAARDRSLGKILLLSNHRYGRAPDVRTTLRAWGRVGRPDLSRKRDDWAARWVSTGPEASGAGRSGHQAYGGTQTTRRHARAGPMGPRAAARLMMHHFPQGHLGTRDKKGCLKRL